MKTSPRISMYVKNIGPTAIVIGKAYLVSLMFALILGLIYSYVYCSVYPWNSIVQVIWENALFCAAIVPIAALAKDDQSRR